MEVERYEPVFNRLAVASAGFVSTRPATILAHLQSVFGRDLRIMPSLGALNLIQSLSPRSSNMLVQLATEEIDQREH